MDMTQPVLVPEQSGVVLVSASASIAQPERPNPRQGWRLMLQWCSPNTACYSRPLQLMPDGLELTVPLPRPDFRTRSSAAPAELVTANHIAKAMTTFRNRPPFKTDGGKRRSPKFRTAFSAQTFVVLKGRIERCCEAICAMQKRDIQLSSKKIIFEIQESNRPKTEFRRRSESQKKAAWLRLLTRPST